MKYSITFLVFFIVNVLLAAQIPTDNLSLYLPFNGNAVDESGNQNDGTTGGVSLTSDRFGNENSAYFFDGIDDYISIANNTLSPTVNATISFWFSPTNDLTFTSGHQIFFQSDVGGDNVGDFIITFNRTNCFSFPSTGDGRVNGELQGDFVNNNSVNCSAFGLTRVASTTDTWNSDEWYNISIVISNGVLTMYVNGVFENSHVTTSAFFRENQEVIMGRYFGVQPTSAFSGKMDDVRVYNRALSTNEISSIYEAVLPVNLISFTATPKQKQVQLDWSTSNESDNSFFEIQRSHDAVSWNEISRVDGSGSTGLVSVYRFIDVETSVGEVYYRLRQVDFDGSSTFSPTISVSFEQLNFSAFPNPTQGLLTVNSGGKITVHDFTGRTLLTADGVSGSTTTILDLSNLRSGLYFVKTETDVQKILKR